MYCRAGDCVASKKRAAAFGMAALAFLLFNGPVYADDTDPFHVDTSSWQSLSRYKEGIKNDPPSAQQSAPADSAPAANTDSTASSQPSAAEPVVATPTRPLDLPVMPGVNKGFEINVSSTLDDSKASAAKITNLDSKPTIQLPEHKWEDAANAAKKAKGKNDDDDESKPLDVRMSFLPNEQITPIPSPELKSMHGRAPPAATGPGTGQGTADSQKSASDIADSAAIDAYKKRQLEAIQSDRQTLQALQAAISQLGLQKQLSFMTGANGSVSPQADNAPANMDFPVSPPAANSGKN